jgi:hypothetical protein
MTDINLILEDFILVGRPDFQALSTHRDNSSNFISAPGWPSFLRPARGLPARYWALHLPQKTALSSSVFDDRASVFVRQYQKEQVTVCIKGWIRLWKYRLSITSHL